LPCRAFRIGKVIRLIIDSEKKIKSFEELQTQPSPLPSEKAEPTRNASKTNQNKK